MTQIAPPVNSPVWPLPTYGWNWDGFIGSSRCLGYNQQGLWALDSVMRLVPGRRAVVQAGGNLGIFPKRLAQEFAAVYTFEPDPKLFLCLVANAPEPRIVKFQAALGCGPGLIGTDPTRRDPKALPLHEGLTHVVADGIIPTFRIDDLALPVCDLIYLDVEGCEAAVLAGAAATIQRCRPVLALEVHAISAAYSGGTVESLRAAVVALGYRSGGMFLSDEVFLPVEAAR